MEDLVANKLQTNGKVKIIGGFNYLLKKDLLLPVSIIGEPEAGGQHLKK